MNTPWVESPFFSEILQTKTLTDTEKKLAQEYYDNGFIVVPGLFDASLIDQVQQATEKGFDKNTPIKTYRDEQRIQDLWTASEPVKALSCAPSLMAILEMLYGREAIPFQTLNFSVGSQQRAHSDTIHFSSLPARFMCGVWVALEDITPDNGAVFYYPGSHRLPEYNFAHIKDEVKDTSYDDYKEYEDFIERIVTRHGFEKKAFYAKKGDALIWSSNIIHGGSKVEKPGSSRWSQVTHYYFKDCVYYTPMLSNMVTNELFLRNNLVNMRTGEEVPQRYNGAPIGYLQTDKGKYIVNNRLKKTSGLQKLFGNFYK
ncbi:MAG TPA: phytanoyl-CoA dioxygenase family protein [Flavisolibacter sp.]|nr:phytanoyl-CoA dioxygenase family protein [Flavisolibacter sp.]